MQLILADRFRWETMEAYLLNPLAENTVHKKCIKNKKKRGEYFVKVTNQNIESKIQK